MEQILEPDLPIVDPHHHLWDFSARFRDMPPPSHPFDHVGRLSPRYLIEELSTDLCRGHNVRATVYMECGAMYRADGPEAFKPVGETEFVNGVAALERGVATQANAGRFLPFRERAQPLVPATETP